MAATYTFNPNDAFDLLVRPIDQADPTAAFQALGFSFTHAQQNADCTWQLVGTYKGLQPVTLGDPAATSKGFLWLLYVTRNATLLKPKAASFNPVATSGTLTKCHVYLIGFTYSGCDDPTPELKNNGFTKFALYPGPDEQGRYAVLALWENATAQTTGQMGKLTILGIQDQGVGQHITSGPCQNPNPNTFVNQTLVALNASAKALSNYLSANGCKCTDPQLATLTTAFQNAWNATHPTTPGPLTVTGQYGPNERAALNSMGTMGVVGAPPCYSLANDGSAPCDSPGATGATGATGGPPTGATGGTGVTRQTITTTPTTTPTAPAPSTGLSTGVMVAIGVAAVGAIGGLTYLMMTRRKPAAPATEAFEYAQLEAPVEVTLTENPRRSTRKRRRRGTTRTSRSGSHPHR